eukprot:TRINITY_DN114520_c0_g1_i1.p1 TRINITY_DN114520_c0_g1~~TRINITY_DN114520_c0_g1_i1.p1  ORF type:complete len:119 (-),score=59.08 TRINITY_DN114520_c0_g1_i1:45-401(-)
MPPKDAKKATKTAKPIVSQIAVGLKRGHVVTKRPTPKNFRAAGTSGKRSKLVKEVIRDVSGFAPYERRLMELLRNDLEKRALKLAKRKLGAHKRAKSKWTEMQEVIRRLREEKQAKQQ